MTQNVNAAAPAVETGAQNDVAKKPFKKFKKTENGVPVTAANYPVHMTSMVLLIKNNAEIRRYTSLGILNYLLQKGEIKGDKKYVKFKWDRFVVKYDGLVREFRYTEEFFLTALVASFTSFANSAGATINAFVRKEFKANLQDVIDGNKVNKTVEDVNNSKADIGDTDEEPVVDTADE